jgi:hypothetical protein
MKNQMGMLFLMLVVAASADAAIYLPDADVGVAYTADLIPFIAGDPTTPITCTLVAGGGPAWVSWVQMTPPCTLAGNPNVADRGVNSWIVQVSDGIRLETTAVEINVR